jgi:1-acyl-sn-glycerol-3-phosphate acyltransferase
MAANNLPPIRNRPLYIWRVCVKVFSFAIFAIGSLAHIVISFPALKLVCRDRKKFQKYCRVFIHFTLRVFVKIMSVLGIVELRVSNRAAYENLGSKILVANHPSLLDIVMLFSLVPNADCIVRGALKNRYNVVSGIVLTLYIPNTGDWEKVMRLCVDSLNEGRCLIIFPEGTRTTRIGENKFQRGAARLSIRSGAPIVPVHFGGTDKYGIGKGDPFFSFNHNEKYIYNLTMLEPLKPEDYAHLQEPIAARAITDNLKKMLLGRSSA